MEVSQELARRRRSRRLWLGVALLVAVALFTIDTASGGRVTLIGFFAIPAFIVAAGAGRRETVVAVFACVALGLLAGVADDFFGSFQHLFRVGLGALAGLLAVRIATMRERAELIGRLDRDVGRALAESRELREATPRLLETVARELEWDAAALWELEGRDGGLVCVQTWQAPGTGLEGYQELRASCTSSRASGCRDACSRAESRHGWRTCARIPRLPVTTRPRAPASARAPHFPSPGRAACVA
jgi:hypothetical protein